MGRPIKDKFFGDPSGPYKQFDDIDAWIPGEAGEEKCYITQQRSDNKYRLVGKTSSGIGICQLVDKAAGSLAEGEMVMTCTPFGGSPERVKAMAQNKVKTFSGNRYRYAKNKRAEKTGECDLSSYNGRPFVTTWRTTAPNETITLPLYLTGPTWNSGWPPDVHPEGLGEYAGHSVFVSPDTWGLSYSLFKKIAPVYNFLVDWGDGNTDLITSWDQVEKTHEYAVAGDYNVSIYGRMDTWHMRYGYEDAGLTYTVEAPKLVGLVQWGDVQFKSLSRLFYKTSITEVNTPDKPDLSLCKSIYSVFRECPNLTYVNMNGWNFKAGPTAFDLLFYISPLIDTVDLRNMRADIRSMNATFRLEKTTGSTSILGLDELDLSRCKGFYVTFFRSMLDEDSLRGLMRSITKYPTSAALEYVNNFEYYKAVDADTDYSITKEIVKNLDTRSMTHFGVFFDDIDTNGITDPLVFDLTGWDMSSAEVLFRTFGYNTQPVTITYDISGWYRTLRKVRTMEEVFYGSTNVIIDLSEFRACRRVETWHGCFDNCTVGLGDIQGIEYLRITDYATDVAYMFRNSDVDISNVDFTQWDVRNVTSATDFMLNGPTMTTEQYDNLLIAWSQLPVQPNVTWHFGAAQYTSGGAAEAARDVLTGAPNNWIITDGGSV
jgi:hypothetical protein